MSACGREIKDSGAEVDSGREEAAGGDCSLKSGTEEAVGGCCMVGIWKGSEWVVTDVS